LFGFEEEGNVVQFKPRHPSFDEFWAIYPRKVCRSAAEQSWRRALAKVDNGKEIIDNLVRSLPGFSPDPQFIPHASTWLNQERWNDAPAPAPAAPTWKD
jgi:hypothetical protein